MYMYICHRTIHRGRWAIVAIYQTLRVVTSTVSLKKLPHINLLQNFQVFTVTIFIL
jgi:hypothetical protein